MQIILDSDFYTQHAVEEMAVLFADYLSVTAQTGDAMLLNFTVAEAHLLEKAEIINTFLNNVLMLSIQEKFNHER
ncbi:hypothetical protein [Brenneria uluponensis]|uniref:hypothetical protein n=1 Tax=Brenneria uluponensis TaxID=3057057 RepID=UPI0028E38DFF|nr:hypothetical protein [Brenneria ulupoensis]